MQKRILVLVVGLPILLFNLSIAFGSGEGTTAAVILTQPIGARPVGMGEAYTAISGDVCGLHYNPAGLASIRGRPISFLYYTGIAGDNFSTVTFGSSTSMGTLAGSFLYYTAGDIELIDQYGNSQTVNAMQDYLLTLSFSRNLVGENFSVGTNAKLLNSTIVEEKSATAFALDLGVLYTLMEGKLAFGLSVQNAGTKLKYMKESAPLPLTVRVGAAYKLDLPEDYKGLAALDIIRVAGSWSANVGLESYYKELFAIRAGYELSGGLESFTSGLGFIVKKICIDYSMMSMGGLGLTHRIALSYGF